MQSFGWRFGWAAPGLGFWSLKAASGFPLFGGLAHHALPGMFPFYIIAAAKPENHASQTMRCLCDYVLSPVACPKKQEMRQNQRF